jgi:hypothetical protein
MSFFINLFYDGDINQNCDFIYNEPIDGDFEPVVGGDNAKLFLYEELSLFVVISTIMHVTSDGLKYIDHLLPRFR